jgi:gamma-glutamylputrescine oxidase
MFAMSFWEREHILDSIDICVVGSGIVGLCSAIHLKNSRPDLRVVVVDRGFLPYGASTRNAGFACFGSISELLDDMSKESENEVFSRVQRRWMGLQKLRDLLGDEPIGFEQNGGYELFSPADAAIEEACFSEMDRINSIMAEITGHPNTYSIQNNLINVFGFKGVHSIIGNSLEGQIDTGKMMLSLIRKASETGVIMLHGLQIQEIEDHEHHCEIQCENGPTLKPRKTLIATNGFAKTFLKELEVEPARAQVLVTSPIADLKFKGIFHYDLGYYYFRNIGNRILFGGGRNLDFETEHTTTFGLTEKIQTRLEELLKTVIIPDADFTVEMRWSGIMGMGPSKSPIIKKTGINTYCSVRMGGMGVAIGALVGEEAAKMVLSDF